MNAPPNRAPTIPHPPAPPKAPDNTGVWAFALAMVGTAAWAAFNLAYTKPDPEAFPREWLYVIMLTLFGVPFIAVSRQFQRQKLAYTTALREHTLLLQRMTPRWARVDSSTLGKRVMNNADGVNVLVGQCVTLQLAVLPDSRETASYRTAESREPEHLTWSARFEPHIAAALAPGAWLEIAYDPTTRIIVSQQLVTRDGAVLPTLDPPPGVET